MMEAWLDALLAASIVLYIAGTARLWREAGRGRGIGYGPAASFVAAWTILAAALSPAADAWSERLFSAHMVQHELLMAVAAPLFVMGRPLQAWAWALPRSATRAVARAFSTRVLRAAWNGATEPLGAWSLHALALWAWHAPVLFEAALRHEGVHVAQHACFLASALFFWWAVIGRPDEAPRGSAVALLFTTMMHTSALGALLALASSPWYPSYAAGSAGLTGLEDQQLGGLVMWLPGSLAYVAAALLIVYRWLAPSPRHIAG